MLVCSQWVQNPTWCGSSALVSGVGLGSAAMGWKFGANGRTATQWRRHGWREFSGNGRRWVIRAGSRWYVVWGNRKLRLWESWIQWRHFKFHTGRDYSCSIHEFNLSSIPNIQQHSRVRGSVGAAVRSLLIGRGKQWNVILSIVLVLFGVRVRHHWGPMSDLVDRLRINCAMCAVPCACVQLCSRSQENQYSMLALPKVCVVCSHNRRTHYTSPTRTLKRNWLEILSLFLFARLSGSLQRTSGLEGPLMASSVLW